jgi:RNA polymerase sigma-70 factor (ECF subfamily)
MEPNEKTEPETTGRHAEFIREALTRHEVPLIRYALGFTGDLETARDVVQDTFLRLCEQPPDSVDGHLTQWLFTVCRNRALDVQRKSKRMTTCTETTEAELDRRAFADHEPTPADTADTRERTAHALDLLADLPPNQREVVRLKFQHQLSYQEIAAVTSLSVGNVGFLLHTALKTLRLRMEKLEAMPAALRA